MTSALIEYDLDGRVVREVHRSGDARWRVHAVDGTGTWFLVLLDPASSGGMEVGAIGPGGYRSVFKTPDTGSYSVAW